MSFADCPNCQQAVRSIEGLCPLCGTALPRGAELTRDELPEPVDTDPDAVLPAEMIDAEDTDPGSEPELSEHEDETHLREQVKTAPAPEEEQGGGPESDPGPTGAQSGESTEEGRKEEEERLLPRLPWGQAIVIGVYVVFGGAFLLYEHMTSDYTRIERHLRAGDLLLGERLGSGADVHELIEAAEHYLAALAIDMHLDYPQQRLDIISRRLEERRGSLPEELAKRHKAISSRAQLEKSQARKGLWKDMPVNPTERFRLQDQRARIRRNGYIFIAGLVALLGWMFMRSSMSRLASREARGPEDTESDGRFIS